MTRIITFLLLAVIMISCDSLLSDYNTKDIQLEVKDYKPLLCVFANYIHEKGLSIELSSTLSIDLSHVGPEITKAKVMLTKQDGQIILDNSIEFNEEGRDFHKVKSNFINSSDFKIKPEYNDTLTISIEVQGYEKVTGKTVIPALVNITESTADKYKAEATMYRFIFHFEDPKEVANYYLVSSVYHVKTTKIPNRFPSDVYFDSTRYQVPITDPLFDFMPNVRSSTKEPFDFSTYKPRIFSDKGFDGNNYGLKVEIPIRIIDPYDASTHQYNTAYELELYSISKDLFEGYKSNYMTKVMEGDIYAEPVILYSNMSNKIGLFGAINGPSKKKATLEQGDWLQFDMNIF